MVPAEVEVYRRSIQEVEAALALALTSLGHQVVVDRMVEFQLAAEEDHDHQAFATSVASPEEIWGH